MCIPLASAPGVAEYTGLVFRVTRSGSEPLPYSAQVLMAQVSEPNITSFNCRNGPVTRNPCLSRITRCERPLPNPHVLYGATPVGFGTGSQKSKRPSSRTVSNIMAGEMVTNSQVTRFVLISSKGIRRTLISLRSFHGSRGFGYESELSFT